MTAKKILGSVFIVLAILLILTIVGQLTKVIAAIAGMIKIFTGSLDSHQTGEVVGVIIYWVAHFAATFALWKFGIKWIKNKD